VHKHRVVNRCRRRAGNNVPISKSLKLLGVTLHAHLTFNEHVNNTCRATFYHL